MTKQVRNFPHLRIQNSRVKQTLTNLNPEIRQSFFKTSTGLYNFKKESYSVINSIFLKQARLSHLYLRYFSNLPKNNNPSYEAKDFASHELNCYEEDLLSYEQVIQLNPLDADAHFNKGVILILLNRFKEALASFEQVIHLNPQDAEAEYYKGVALDKLGHSKEALVCFERAVQHNPQDFKAYQSKGIALDKLGRPKEALFCFEQAIHLNPQNATVYASHV